MIELTCVHFPNQDAYFKLAETLLDARIYRDLPWYQLGSRFLLVVTLYIDLLRVLLVLVIVCLLRSLPVPPVPSQPSTLRTFVVFVDLMQFCDFCGLFAPVVNKSLFKPLPLPLLGSLLHYTPQLHLYQ